MPFFVAGENINFLVISKHFFIKHFARPAGDISIRAAKWAFSGQFWGQRRFGATGSPSSFATSLSRKKSINLLKFGERQIHSEGEGFREFPPSIDLLSARKRISFCCVAPGGYMPL